MTLSMVYGSAFQTTILYDDRLRLYRHGDKSYVGYDTSDIVHVCDETCLFQVVDDDVYAPADNDSRVFVSIHPRPVPAKGVTYVDTIDVVDFDPGDDPYVLCGACGTELLRDDDKFYEQYGRHIWERS